jgi:antitoxin ChpS
MFNSPMTHVTLRKLGGSVVMVVPKKILSLLDLEAGSQVRIGVEDGRIVIEPESKPRYTLAQLLSRCKRSDLAPKRSDREWFGGPSIGKEEI